jgi:hypothetical protein
MLVAGAAQWSDYLVRRFVDAGQQASDSHRTERLGAVHVWRLPAILERWRGEVDLVCARVDVLSSHWFPRDRYFHVPAWIRLVAEVPPSGARFGSKQARRYEALVARHRLGWRVSHALDDLDTFYHRDYVPFIRRRHGDGAGLRSRQWLQRRFRDGGLVWVEREGEVVAGLVYDVRGKVLRRLASACARGDEHSLEIGGISATHLAAFEIARSLGCKSVDLRFCRPSPADGLFQVKRAWGGDFVDNRTDAHDYDFLVGWSRTTPAVLRFLSATPLIVRHRCGYAALVADRCSLARLRTPPGIAGFIVPEAGRGFADRVLLPPFAARHSPG